MKIKDTRPYFIWFIVIISNLWVISYLFLDFAWNNLTRLLPELYDDRASFLKYYSKEFLSSEYVIAIVLFIFLSLSAVFLAKSKYKWKHYIGYGLPLLSLIPIAYNYWAAITCTGKWCGMVYGFWILIISFVFGTFCLFYTVGFFFRKWKPELVMVLTVLIFAVLFYTFYDKFNYFYTGLLRRY